MPGEFDRGIALIRLYIVDDDLAVGRTVSKVARSIGLDPTIFGSPAQFLEQLEGLDPGTICLDIRMPGMSGIELLKQLARKRPDWPVIMLTGYAEVGAAVEAFRSGAIHFLRKPFRNEELAEALREAAELGGRRLKQAIGQDQLEALQRLTRREREVLDAITRGLQSKEIAWQLGISIRTVDLHRSNILAKLSVRNAAQAVAMAQAAALKRDG